MACPGVGMTAAGFGFAAGAMSGGGGMFSKMTSIATNAGGSLSPTAALGGIAKAAASVGDHVGDPLQYIPASAAAAVAAIPGANAVKAALTGAAPAAFAGAMTNPSDMLSSLASHATTYLPGDMSSAIQIAQQALSFSEASIDMMPNLTRALNTGFGEIAGTLTDFTDGGFLGEAFNNFNDVISNGLGSLTDGIGGSLTELGSSFASLGKFGDMADIGNLMKPGQIASQLLSNDLGDIGGFANKLLENGIPLDDLTNGIYQDKIQGIMNGMTNVQDLIDIKQVMGSSINLNSLGDVTNFQNVLGSAVGKSFSDFGEMAEKFTSIEVGKLANVGELGEMMSEMVDSTDLNYVMAETGFLSQANFDVLSGIYGNGSGPDGSVLMRDMLGTSAGYGHEVFLDSYKQGMDILDSDGTTGTLATMYDELTAGLNGDYLDVPGDFGGSVDITDPRSGSVFTEMEAFVTAKTAQISSELNGIVNSVSTNTQELLTVVGNNWNTSAAQLDKEVSNLSLSDVDVSLVTAGHKGSILSFAQQLNQYGADVKNKGEFFAKTAQNNLTGDFLKLALREGQNRALLNANDVKYTAALVDEEEDIEPFDTSVG